MYSEVASVGNRSTLNSIPLLS